MKDILKVILVILFVLISGESVLSQIESGDKELSISASFMSRKSENAMFTCMGGFWRRCCENPESLQIEVWEFSTESGRISPIREECL